MNVKIYDIDFAKLTRLFLPHKLRFLQTIAWWRVLARPITTLYLLFLRYRDAKIYQLIITSQVCYLQRMLNDRFDFTLRRIFVDDAVWHQPFYLYQEAELSDKYLYQESELQPVYLWTDSEAGDDKDDFIVLVPMALQGFVNVGEMTSLLKKYKLSGTHFKIEFI